MPFQPEHELHGRRFGRNVGVGLVLLAFAGIVFGLTIVKVTGGAPMEAYDHSVRPSITTEGSN